MPHRIAAALAAMTIAGMAHAQDEAPTVYLDVEGAAIEVTPDQAAEACGLDPADIAAAPAGTAATDAAGSMASDGDASAEAPATDGAVSMAQGSEDPSTTEPANADAALLAQAVCAVDVETAAGLGIPTTAEIVTE